MHGIGVLQIEPTDYCNLSCQMCKPHHQHWNQIHGIPKGFLSIELFDSIVDGFLMENIEFDHIIFQWLGDPLLHPKIDVLLQKAQRMKQNIKYLRMDTNGIALDDQRIQNILQSAIEGAPLLIVFSVDAFSSDVYQDVKGANYRDRVFRNIRHFIRQRRILGHTCHVNIQIQFVVQQQNYHEILPFLQYFVDILQCQGSSDWHDEILFKPLSVDGGGEGQQKADTLYQSVLPLIQDFASSNQEKKQDKNKSQETNHSVAIKTWSVRPWQQNKETDSQISTRSACPGLWMTPVIRHDGELLLCCADLQSEMALGNLRKNSFLSLWHSPKALQKRKEHLEGVFRGVCEGCGGINWYTLTPKMIQETQQQIQDDLR